MDIHINTGAVNGKQKSRKGIPAAHQKIFVGMFYGTGDHRTFDVPAIHEIIDKCPISPGELRFPDKSPQTDAAIFCLHRYKAIGYVCAIVIKNIRFQIPVPGGLQSAPAIHNKMKPYFGMAQGITLHQILYIISFRRLCFQKFHYGRRNI